MIIVGDTLVSEDILEGKFVCHLEKCKGACCVSGDRGAPLSQEETVILEKELDSIRPFMDDAGCSLLDNRGYFETDPSDGELVTTCRNDGACVFVVFENGVAKCAVEDAHSAGKTDFKKPLSCHLYPIRTARYGTYSVANYHRWDICDPACKLGAELQVPLYEFLKEPLIRFKGETWYSELEDIAKDWRDQKK